MSSDAAILTAHPHRSTWRAWVVVAACALVLSPVHASAQQLWGELRLPGGARVARTMFNLGTADDRMDSTWLFDFVRHQLIEQPGNAALLFDAYVRAIDAVQIEAVKWPEGFVVPPATASAQERDLAEHALKTLGLALRRRDGKYQVELDQAEGAAERAGALRTAGINRAALAVDLNAGKPVKIALADSILPLPLPAYWAEDVFERGAPPIATIARSRSHALRYVGLLSLDAETLAFLAARPRFVKRLGDEVGGTFAAFGRSLHIRNDAVDVPGGESAASVWQALVGRPPADAERFVMDLLGRENGRLAYFYDTVAHLSLLKQQFVLGHGRQAADRVQFVRRIADRFASGDSNWMIERLPFRRPAFDPAVAFMFIDVLPDGSIGPAWLPPLLEAVVNTDAWPARSDRTPRQEWPDGHADAQWMTDWLFDVPGDAQARFALLRFAQRRFAAAPRASAPLVEIALRAARDMPALPLALERMGVTDPAIYSALAIAAHNLTIAGDADEVGPALARWQAALALLEQAQRRLRLSQEELRPLLISFADLTPSDRRQAPGATAAWVTEHLLPALVPAGPVDEIESRALRAFIIPASRARISVKWEGLDYVVDDAGVALRSAVAIRQTQPGPTLGELVGLHVVRKDLERGARTTEDVSAIAAAMTRLEPALASLATLGEGSVRVVRDFRAAIVQLERISDVRDASQTAKQVPVLLEAIDAVTDAVVPALVYALAVAGTPDPPAVYQETWRWHSIMPPSQTPGSWTRIAWRSPAADRRLEGGQMMRGAYLSLDVALAESQLARAISVESPRAQRVPISGRTTLVRALVLGNPDRFLDASRSAVSLAALGTGRRRVAGWDRDVPPPQSLRDDLRRAAVDEWRANVIAWDAQHAQSNVLTRLTPLEVLRLELIGPVPPMWDAPAPGPDACVCLQPLDALSAEDLRGRESGLMVALLPNLSLRLAEVLRELELPVSLVPVLLPVAAQDWIDNTAQVWADDWEALTLWPKHLSKGRVEEYLLFLVSEAILTSPSTAGAQ